MLHVGRFSEPSQPDLGKTAVTTDYAEDKTSMLSNDWTLAPGKREKRESTRLHEIAALRPRWKPSVPGQAEYALTQAAARKENLRIFRRWPLQPDNLHTRDRREPLAYTIVAWKLPGLRRR